MEVEEEEEVERRPSWTVDGDVVEGVVGACRARSGNELDSQ